MKKNIKGTVVLMKKNVLDVNDFRASILDQVYEIFGKRISIKLITIATVIFFLYNNIFVISFSPCASSVFITIATGLHRRQPTCA
ncbi:hypothetical protein L2E82_11028 [Cichorium intybus]|uniref:Uncharacterized protein n=2 Tax=Cichorium intybus TaxID=13427 RepID=A0ACB9GBP2_CICIN|nr:hypothetical protein L2E82_21113 [Cichorium intybus]KAI3781029.1 hypothetical protein L2E82_11028 [Cichorium intybus]